MLQSPARFSDLAGGAAREREPRTRELNFAETRNAAAIREWPFPRRDYEQRGTDVSVTLGIIRSELQRITEGLERALQREAAIPDFFLPHERCPTSLDGVRGRYRGSAASKISPR
jgi:hypothetical protein